MGVRLHVSTSYMNKGQAAKIFEIRSDVEHARDCEASTIVVRATAAQQTPTHKTPVHSFSPLLLIHPHLCRTSSKVSVQRAPSNPSSPAFSLTSIRIYLSAVLPEFSSCSSQTDPTVSGPNPSSSLSFKNLSRRTALKKYSEFSSDVSNGIRYARGNTRY